jgi:hypothetical protein
VYKFFSLTAVFLFVLCAPAAAAVTQIPFAELGHEADLTLTGPNPQFTLFVPVYPQLQSVRIHVPLRFSPVMDRRSTVSVTVNDRIVSTTTLGALGESPVVDQTINVPKGTRGAMQIALVGRFFEKGDVCFDLDTSGFWMTVGHGGILTANTAPSGHAPFVRDFLRDYGGRIVVVVPANGGSELQYEALRLAYGLHQSNRWRRTTVTLADRPDPSARNVVLGTFSKALEMHGGDLYANADGVAVLQHRFDDLLVTTDVQTASTDARAGSDVHQQTFDELGFASQTLTGTGEMPFTTPLQFGRLGGMPQDLELHVALTHTPVLPEERAFVKVTMNGTLVRSFEFRPEGGEESYDVPIGQDLLRSSNDLRVVPTYFYKRDACKGSYPRMTTSLLGTSSISWGSVVRRADGVGDFYNLASGRVVVLIGSSSDVSYAFSLLDGLGATNTSIRQLDVQPYDGTIPEGYDYAIVVAAPDRLSGVDLPLLPGAHEFTIKGESSGNVVYRARYAQPFGVLEVDSKGSPALYATYWKDPSAAQGLSRIAPGELAEQAGDVVLFDQERATYSSPPQRARQRPDVDPLRKALLPVLGVFGVLLLALLAWTALRARAAS